MKWWKRKRQGGKQPYSPEQPKGGDTILHCGHICDRKTRGAHAFATKDQDGQVGEGIRFQRPDGSWGVAGWIVVCHPCFILSKGNPLKVPIKGDSLWVGDEPEFKTVRKDLP